jgi:hypothetical protein
LLARVEMQMNMEESTQRQKATWGRRELRVAAANIYLYR